MLPTKPNGHNVIMGIDLGHANLMDVKCVTFRYFFQHVTVYKQVCPQLAQLLASMTRAQLHGSAYRKYRIGAHGSREFCAYGKRISRVSGKFWLLRVRTPR